LRNRSDRNAARLLGLGDLADEIDMQQAVLERGVLHGHEVGQLEHTLEGSRRDAAVKHFGIFLGILVGDFLALDRQRVFLGDDRKLALRKAGNCNADAIGVLAGALDIIGRVAGAAVGGGLVEQLEETVEADRGTIEGGKVKGTHESSPPLSDC